MDFIRVIYTPNCASNPWKSRVHQSQWTEILRQTGPAWRHTLPFSKQEIHLESKFSLSLWDTPDISIKILTFPKTLPDFPLISSKLSGFFFCGIKLLPVLLEKAKQTKLIMMLQKAKNTRSKLRKWFSSVSTRNVNCQKGKNYWEITHGAKGR